MGRSCRWVTEKEVVHEDSNYRVRCCLIPHKGRPQSNQTPDLWLKPQPVEFRANRMKRGRKKLWHNNSELSAIIKGLFSPDHAQQEDEWMNEILMLLHILPAPRAHFSSPRSFPLLLFCLKFNKVWNSGGPKWASGVFWLGFMSHAEAMWTQWHWERGREREVSDRVLWWER